MASHASNAPIPSDRQYAKGLLFGAFGVLIFGGTYPATRFALIGLDPAFVTAGRAAVAGILAAALLLALRRPLPPREIWRTLLIGGVLIVGGFPFFSTLALKTAEASHGGIIIAFLPLATAAAATLLANEHLSRSFWAYALAGAIVVLSFVVIEAKGSFLPSDGLFVIAALCAAAGYALSGTLSREMPGWEVICWQLVAALPITITIAFFSSPAEHIQTIPTSAWLGFGYVSFFSMFLGIFAWNAGLGLGGVAKVGQLQLFQVFVTLLASSMLLGEKLDNLTFGFGCLLVVIVALGQRAKTEVKP